MDTDRTSSFQKTGVSWCFHKSKKTTEKANHWVQVQRPRRASRWDLLFWDTQHRIYPPFSAWSAHPAKPSEYALSPSNCLPSFLVWTVPTLSDWLIRIRFLSRNPTCAFPTYRCVNPAFSIHIRHITNRKRPYAQASSPQSTSPVEEMLSHENYLHKTQDRL